MISFFVYYLNYFPVVHCKVFITINVEAIPEVSIPITIEQMLEIHDTGIGVTRSVFEGVESIQQLG